MRLQPRSQNGTSAIFVHSNTTKPSHKVLDKLAEGGVIKFGDNDLRFENVQILKSKSTVKTATGKLFLWKSSDHVIVSDIDGTITKSDVVGLVDSIAVENYGHTHPGVCKLFGELSEMDSVRFVYLTSRPISLMHFTRKFLENLRQESLRLPLGATLCHTGSVKDVLLTELVTKDPDKFKADVLWSQVMIPFLAAGKPEEETLFTAGFGNKLTDAKAYADKEKVGILLKDIYIINKSSCIMRESDRVKLEKEAFEAVKGNGRRSNMRRNSILKRMPDDIRDQLCNSEAAADENSEQQQQQQQRGLGTEATNNTLRGRARGRLSVSAKKMASKARSLSPGKFLSRISTAFNDTVLSSVHSPKSDGGSPVSADEPSRKFSRKFSFLEVGGMNEIRHKMKEVEMGGYDDPRLRDIIRNRIKQLKDRKRIKKKKLKDEASIPEKGEEEVSEVEQAMPTMQV